MAARISGLVAAGAMAALISPAPSFAQLPLPPLLPPGEPPSEPSPTPAPPPSKDPAPRRTPSRPPPDSASAVTYRGDIARTAYTPLNTVVAPLEIVWGRRLGRESYQPVIANGLIFTVTGRSSRSGADARHYRLQAFDVNTGRERWRREHVSGPALAYDGGRLFLAGGSRLSAFRASSGKRLWTRTQGQERLLAPVAADGRVFVTNGFESLLAYRARDGRRLWLESAVSAGQSVPAVWRGRIFASSGCDVHAFDVRTGKRRWSYRVGCSGGGSSVAAVRGGRVYGDPTASHPPLDADTGAPFKPRPGAHLLAPGIGLFAGWGLDATSLATGRRLWSAKLLEPYSGFDLRPAGAGAAIWVLDQAGDLRGYGLRRGDLRERLDLFDDSISIQSAGDVSLAIGSGVLAVPVSGWLVVLRSALRPPPRKIGTRLSLADLRIGNRTRLDGRAGSKVGGRRVRLEADPYPYRGFRRLRTARIDPMDRTFRFRLRPDRNTRYRVRVVGSARRRSRAIVGYVYPRVHISARQSGSVVAARVSVRGAPGVRLANRRLVLYVARARTGAYERLGSGTLRRTGPTRAQAQMTLRRARFGSRDGVAFCIPGLRSMGRPDRLQRRCGAARVRG